MNKKHTQTVHPIHQSFRSGGGCFSSEASTPRMEGLSEPNQNHNLQEEEKDEEISKLALRLAFNVSLSMVLKSVIELNILDIIAEAGANAFLSPADIAAKLTTKNPDAPIYLDRMLSLLASHSVLKCSVQTGEDGEVLRFYGLGPISKFYLKNQGDGSFGPLLLLLQDKIFGQSWYHLNDAVLEGGVPFHRAYGMNAFEYPGKDKRFNQVFNQAMSNHTKLIMKKILDVYSGLEEVKVLVDVGGGTGVNLNMIISKYPHIKGINYDLPHVVLDAPAQSGVENLGGDMFESVPQGDAIFMKWILHDWSDNHCLKLLKNCCQSLPDNGKVIIVESIVPETPENNVSANVVYLQDIFMLAQNPGGKERTLKEFKALATKSGFASCEVICSAYNFWVLEFHKK